MKITKTEINDVLILEPTIFRDERGYFQESYNQKRFDEVVGKEVTFVQDNHSFSHKNVLRGLHYQCPPKVQGKLVRCIAGEIFDVAVDLREGSPSYGCWVGVRLSSKNQKQLWIPPGFAHGFLTLSDEAELLYKTTEFYSQSHEGTICWNDETLGIEWPLSGTSPTVSEKDSTGEPFSEQFVYVRSPK